MTYTKEQLDDLNGITSTRHGFMMPLSLKTLVKSMPPQEKGLFLEAVFEYVETGLPSQQILKFQTSLPYFAFMQFVEQYDKDARKYLDKVKKNREAGKKGGSVPRHNPETGEVMPDKHPKYG